MGWDEAVQPHAGDVGRHLQDEERCGEGHADPEPSGHVGEFGIRLTLDATGYRLQRHAADRAVARPFLPDLRVHGAGVDDALHRGRLLLVLGVMVLVVLVSMGMETVTMMRV